jgi:hypothetical protein
LTLASCILQVFAMQKQAIVQEQEREAEAEQEAANKVHIAGVVHTLHSTHIA